MDRRTSYRTGLEGGTEKRCARCRTWKPANADHFSARYEEGTENLLDSWCRECRRQTRQEWGERNAEYVREYMADNRGAVRLQVLQHYGGDPPECECCSETTLQFLHLDHLHGGGNQHRKKIGKGGASFYRWIVAEGLPEGYRILCANCNVSLGHYGYCPHRPFRDRVLSAEQQAVASEATEPASRTSAPETS